MQQGSKHFLVIEHRFPDYEKRLRDQLNDAHAEIEKLKHEHHILEIKYGWEITLNNELIDLCNQYHVPYRDLLDFRKHPF